MVAPLLNSGSEEDFQQGLNFRKKIGKWGFKYPADRKAGGLHFVFKSVQGKK